MIVTDRMMQDILIMFGCEEPCIKKRNTLLEMDYWSKGTHVVKQYEKVDAGEVYVVKFLLLPNRVPQYWQAQAVLAEFYRKEGIPTPKHMTVINAPGNYVYCCQIQGEPFMIMAETWAGKPLAEYSEKTAVSLGSLLGKMHAISEKKKCIFQPGSLYREVCKGNTNYLFLWKSTGTQFLSKKLLEETVRLYNNRFFNMMKVWEKLPRYTVHGDLYWMNLTVKENQLQIIDYDRIGDEVLAADLAQTWFRLWYDEKIHPFLSGITMEVLWKKFLEAYKKERALTVEERQAFADIYAVFGSIYCTKMLVQKAASGNTQEVLQKFPEVLKILKTPEEIL